jgi:hypothetical protein
LHESLDRRPCHGSSFLRPALAFEDSSQLIERGQRFIRAGMIFVRPGHTAESEHDGALQAMRTLAEKRRTGEAILALCPESGKSTPAITLLTLL